MADTLVIDVRDMSVAPKNPVNIAVINQPNPVTGFEATDDQILNLLSFPKYMIKETATGNVITGNNFYKYFPEDSPGGGGGGGGGTTDTYSKRQIDAMLAKKQNTLLYDNFPTKDSENDVKSGGIYSYVNSSIETETANFIGTFNSLADLQAYSGTVTNNDYAFVIATDSSGNTIYKRYKYNGETSTWVWEYDINNSSFTAAEWAAIQSGITSSDKTNWDNHVANLNNPHAVTAAQLGLGDVNTILTPISESEYEQLQEKDKSLYFIYED